MKPAARWALRGAIALGAVVVVVLVVRAWIVPAAIARTLRAQFHGAARFDDWWLNRGSAGVSGLTLREGAGSDSPAWLSAERVTTDLTLGGLLRGRRAPTKLDVRGPKLTLRFARDGHILTKGPFEGGPSATPGVLPEIDIESGEMTIEQEGRPPLVIRGVSGKVVGDEDGTEVALASDDPELGRWSLRGRLASGFHAGGVRLTSGPGFAVTREMTARVPFVPPEVWQNLAPSGPVGVAVILNLTEGTPEPFHVRTELTFLGATAGLPTLGIVAEETRGTIVVDGGLVRVDGLTGRSLSGSISATGSLDFRPPAPRFDLRLGLDDIDVARAPASWQLGEVGATGRLKGTAHLIVAMKPDGADLTGSSGEAVIAGAVIQGIPIKSLRLAMQAEGTDLKFDAKDASQSSTLSPPTLPYSAKGEWTFRNPLPLWGRVGWGVLQYGLGRITVPTLLPALQAPAAQKPQAPRFHLPSSITTHIELEDVDLTTVLARLKVLSRIEPPVPMAGKLSLKADATIPLGHLGDVKDYTIRGQATLKGATIDAVDLGRLSARFALVKGVLDLEELHGQLVERPAGTAHAPAPATPSLAADAPLPAGGFRGKLHAELSPAGKLTAHFEARELPLSELAAPFFPVPTPVGGRLSADLDVSGSLAHLDDPKAWTVKGRVASDRLRYCDATLDAFSSSLAIEGGEVSVPDLAAKLGDNPLTARLRVDLAGTRPFSGELDVKGWAIERALALIPRVPRPAPATGILDGRVTFRGTIRPLSFSSDGRILVRGATVESVPLGDVSAEWATQGDSVVVRDVEARPFGGRLSARATIPTTPDRPARVQATFSGIKTEQIAEALTKGQLALTGTAGGRLDATVGADPKALAVDLTLQAPDLTVQGLAAGTVAVTVRGKGESIEYAVTADGPLGKASFTGSVPLGGPSPDKAANAEIRGAGFGLADLARIAGMPGVPPELKGRVALDANLRARSTDPTKVAAHGFVEVRDLRWGDHFPIGWARGVVLRSADAWRIDEIRGELAGGVLQGEAWGQTPAGGPHTASFTMETDRADLARLLTAAPGLARHTEGFATIRLAGRVGAALDANAEMTVNSARIGGVPIADFRMPAEFVYQPAEGRGTLHARRWTARVAGGRAQGSATLRVGVDKSFSAEVELADVDVESLMRIGTTDARPGSGKVNGKVTIGGTDPSRPKSYRGQVRLGLHDASIGDIPVIRGLDRFLGAAQGGAFEAGFLRATIADGRLLVDDLRLEGRVLQIHGTGVVTFGGGVDLAVLVNTNQIIPQTGEALASIIPGLRQAMGRDEEARLRVANYLSNRLLKFRVSGTIANPSIAPDRGIAVGDTAAGFFAGVLKLPLGLVK